MTKKNLWRVLGVATLSLLSIAIGAKVIFAEVTPTIDLTNSVNNWTVTQGTQITLQARVWPDYYHTVSRVEIRQGTNVIASCVNQNNCSYTIASVPYGTTYYQAVGFDVDGRIFSSQVMNLVGNSNNGSQVGSNGIILTSTASEVDPIANSGMYLESRATSNGANIREVRMYRVDDWQAVAINNCSNEPYNCTVRFYPTFNSNDAGKTYTYEAQTTDVNGSVRISNRVTVYVRYNNGNNGVYGNQMPGVYLDRGTIPEQVNSNNSVSMHANAWDNEGLSNLSIYAYPQNSAAYSSNPHFEKICGTTLHNVDCTLDISNFYGYEGVTFNVWAETTDQAGQRAVSQYYTLRVNNNTPAPTPTNNKPGIAFSSSVPSNVNAGQSVNITVNAWDNEGLRSIFVAAVPKLAYQYQYGYGYNSTYYKFIKVCNVSGNNASCTLSINDFYGFEGSDFTVYAIAYDTNWNTANTGEVNMHVNGTAPAPNQKPTLSVTAPSEVRANENMNLRAEAWDNEGLSKITFSAFPIEANQPNRAGKGATKTKTCAVSGKYASCSFDVQALPKDVGFGYSVWVSVTDSNGYTVYADAKKVNVLPALNVAPTVVTTVSGNVNSLAADKSLIVFGRATSPTGVWGVEVRAQPSWSSDVITRRCLMTNMKSTVGTCSLSIGPFTGHAGQNVKVWTIAWGTDNGLGGSSDTRTINITESSRPNYAPTASVTASANPVNANQTVTFRANGNDENGIQKIDLYVNAMIVKTCTGTTTCEYTGGPFRNYAGSSVTYAAKVWDTTGKTTWTGYSYIRVGN